METACTLPHALRLHVPPSAAETRWGAYCRDRDREDCPAPSHNSGHAGPYPGVRKVTAYPASLGRPRPSGLSSAGDMDGAATMPH